MKIVLFTAKAGSLVYLVILPVIFILCYDGIGMSKDYTLYMFTKFGEEPTVLLRKRCGAQ